MSDVNHSDWKPTIYWHAVCHYLVLHIALVYGIILLVTGQVGFATILWALAIYGIGGFATGIGSHRYFAHKAFRATRGMKIFLICCHTLAGQWSIHYFCQTHRIHHKFNDTDKDPSNIKRGFLFAYVGNYIYSKHPECQKEWNRIDLSDIESDSDIMFQHNNFNVLRVVFAIVFPIFVPICLWNETLWIATWMNLYRLYFNSTHIGFSNSINHWFGNRPFNAETSATDSFWMNLYLFGEGNHNFHHTFPQDYKGAELDGLRNFNITTTLIHMFAAFGWVFDLKTASPESIAKRLKRTGDGSYKEKLIN